MVDELARLERLVQGWFANMQHESGALSSYEMAAFRGLLGSEGYDFLGEGGSRVVVALSPDLVAKIDTMIDWAGVNRTEADRWREAERVGYGEVFNPVLFITESDMAWMDSRILVTPRAQVVFEHEVPRGRKREYASALKSAIEFFEQCYPGSDDVEDIHYPFNWGIVDGQVRCIDYGS